MDGAGGNFPVLPGGIIGRAAIPFLSFLLFLSVFYLPGVGLAFNFFAPLPLIYFFFTNGRQPWFLAVAVVAVIIGVLLGYRAGLFYVATYGVLGLLMSEMILRREELGRVITVSAFGALFITGLLMVITFPFTGGNFYADLIQQAQIMVEQALVGSRQSGMPLEQVEEIKKNLETIATWFVNLLPATVTVAYLLMAFVNFIGFRRLQTRFTFLPEADPRPLSSWTPPEQLVWVFLVSLGVTVLTEGWLMVAGANLLLITGAVYVLGGVAVIEFFLDRFKAPFFLRITVYTLVIIQPFFLSMIAGFGLFDLWLDFRRLKQKKAEPDVGSDDKEE